MNSKINFPFVLLFLLSSPLLLIAQSRNPCNCPPPSIISQPQSNSGLCVQNSQATFSVTAVSANNIHYQWQIDTVNITDNTMFFGSNTSTLTITNPTASLNGKMFRCIVKNCMNIPIASAAARLSLDISATDVNEDGVTNNADFALVLGLYDDSCSSCREDINQDGIVNILDFLRLLSRFNQTCN